MREQHLDSHARRRCLRIDGRNERTLRLAHQKYRTLRPRRITQDLHAGRSVPDYDGDVGLRSPLLKLLSWSEQGSEMIGLGDGCMEQQLEAPWDPAGKDGRLVVARTWVQSRSDFLTLRHQEGIVFVTSPVRLSPIERCHLF